MRFAVLVLVACMIPRATLAQDARRDEARQHVAQGEALFARDNFEAALAEFERVYELLDGNPNRHVVLFNIAQCHERLFRYDAALQSYRRYLDEGGAAVTDRADVEATMRALDGLLATVDLQVSVPRAEVWVDDHRVGAAGPSLRIPGGRHVVMVRAAGYLPSQQEVQIAARSRRAMVFTLERVPPPRRRLSPVYFASAAGLAVVGAGVATWFGLRALAERDAIDLRLADPVDRFGVTEADRQSLQRTMTATDVALGGAALFGVAAGVLAFVTEWSPAPRTDPPQGVTARLAPMRTATATGVAIEGAF
jgi:hypothetical protein